MKPKPSIYVHYIKPLLDFGLALMLMILLIPVMIVIIPLYLLSGEKPIFFCQERVGKDNSTFKLFKFRTLTTTADGSKSVFPIGYFLRKTSLDEIPQVINILKQDMSFVGPRPLLPEYQKLYSQEQIKRHLVKPGITGWAQVNGRNQLPWNKRFDLDLYYVKHISLLLDFKILIMTALNYFKQDNVMPDFNEPFKGV